jgi:endonuclease/exonuclease/phosphatase family metal-dependent hydrolase
LRRSALRTLTGLLSAMLMGAAHVATSPSATADFQTLTMNLCGGKSTCSTWSSAKTQQIGYAISNRSGDFVALQEICDGQVADIWNVLYYTHGRSFYRYQATTVSGVGGTNCAYNTGRSTGNYGIAVLTPHPSPFVSVHALPGGAEPRKMICAENSAEGKSIEFCSTHLTANESNASDIRRKQVESITQTAKNYGAVRGILIGGDFNAEPWSYELEPIRAVLPEADDTYRARYADDGSYNTVPINQEFDSSFPNTNSYKKLDYLFYGAARIHPDTGDVRPVTWSTLSSSFDHRFYPSIGLGMK